MSQEAVIESLAERLVGEIAKERPRYQKRTQREILLDVLRLAAQCESWLTLEELAVKTKFPPASISAQLRHLRKEKYGGWKVERRQRRWMGSEVVWEYKLGV